MKIRLITLGCPKNIVDSEWIAGGLLQSGAELLHHEGEADAVIINTCGFIQSAKEESIETILEAVECKKRGEVKKVFITGCLSERYGEALRREIPELDGIYGNRDLEKIVQDLAFRLDLRRELLGERHLLTPSHYAFLKISEGCEHPCTFCAIPAIRGAFRSRPMEALIEEARKQVEHGVKEIILIAQDTTIYGLDLYGEKRLPELLRRLSRIDGVEWIRLMYAYPFHVTDELLEVIAETDTICKYVDMPIQHISNRMLKRMARRMDRKAHERLIQKMRQLIPGLTLRTSVIVGFPGETEDDFRELMDYVAEGHFDHLGVFTFSPEEGTPAAAFPHQVPEAVKRERQDILIQIQDDVCETKNREWIGREVRVLVDEFDAAENVYLARREGDAPEIDNCVVLPQACQKGAFYRVKLVSADAHEFTGEILSKETAQPLTGKPIRLPVARAEGVTHG